MNTPNSNISDDTKAVLGGVFGMMRPGGTLDFAMKQSRPSSRTQAALDEAVTAGWLERSAFEQSGVRFTLRAGTNVWRLWLARNQKRADLRFPISEPIPSEASS